MIKKGQVCEGIVEDIAFPNKGHIKIEGQTVVVKNALPGQKVRFSINKVRGSKAEGRLLEVLARGEEETKPQCECFGECGGCLYLSLPYERQLAIKEKQVRILLSQALEGVLIEEAQEKTLAADTCIFDGMLPSPSPYGYRNKMEFSFGDLHKDGPLTLGMHKRGSFYDIVTADTCQLVDADFRLILRTVLDFFSVRNASYYHKQRHVGFLRHLLLRKGAKSGEILIDLVTSTQGELEEEAFVRALLALQEGAGRLQGRIVGILHTVNDSVADAIRNDRTDILYGQAYFYEELLGLRFRITPFSFFQTNSLGAEVLYDTVRSYVGSTKDMTVFDLYSGTGTIAQMLAPVAKKVIGVEIVEEAVVAARENAKLNGLSNCTFIAGDVLQVIDEIAEKPDLIVLDPPRDGVNGKALKKIIAYNVPRMVYISCKLTSLVRDLQLLQESGYQVERCAAVDMFPWTGNIETICLLTRIK